VQLQRAPHAKALGRRRADSVAGLALAHVGFGSEIYTARRVHAN